MGQRVDVCLAGEGGQGLILAGVILAEAAVVYDGKWAAQTQSYGAEARGGASKAEVIIADEPVDYPRLTQADVLLAMSREACERYAPLLLHGGLLIVDSLHVPTVPTGRAYSLPITAIAERATGRAVTANVTALGLLAGLTGVVSRPALERAVAARAPLGTAEVNLHALAAGYEAAATACRGGLLGGC